MALSFQDLSQCQFMLWITWSFVQVLHILSCTYLFSKLFLLLLFIDSNFLCQICLQDL